VVPEASGGYDVVLVAVRSDQLTSACAGLAGLAGKPAIVFLGNNPAGRPAISGDMPGDVYLGFPGVGGVMSGGTADYVRIRQQPTALQETSDPRLAALEAALSDRGFAVQRVADMDGWLAYHAAFVACIAAALFRCGTNPVRPGHQAVLRRYVRHSAKQSACGARSYRGVPMLKMMGGGTPGAAGDVHDHCASAGYTPYAVRLKMTLSAPVSAGRANTS
jgi:ketopantoate reductase